MNEWIEVFHSSIIIILYTMEKRVLKIIRLQESETSPRCGKLCKIDLSNWKFLLEQIFDILGKKLNETRSRLLETVTI